jgi:hypothetical protein
MFNLDMGMLGFKEMPELFRVASWYTYFSNTDSKKGG